MIKKYFQLTLEQRYKIESLKTAGLGQTEIAKIIGVNKSTVCREFKRNIPLRGLGAKLYVAEKAQKKTDLRHYEKYKPISFSIKMKHDARQMMMVQKYSPELISAQWRKDGKAGVSHETIYKWIWECKHSNRKEYVKEKRLYLHLKHGHRRRRMKKNCDCSAEEVKCSKCKTLFHDPAVYRNKISALLIRLQSPGQTHLKPERLIIL